MSIRKFYRGTRNVDVSLNLSALNVVSNDEDKSLLTHIAKTGSRCIIQDGHTLKDIALYDDTSEEDHKATGGRSTQYRLVITISGNAPITKSTLDTIESCNPKQITMIGVVTHIPRGYREPTNIPEEDESYKEFCARPTAYKSALYGSVVTTNITVRVISSARRDYQEIIAESTGFVDIPREGKEEEERQPSQKRRMSFKLPSS
jgi:hypothetical protein